MRVVKIIGWTRVDLYFYVLIALISRDAYLIVLLLLYKVINYAQEKGIDRYGT